MPLDLTPEQMRAAGYRVIDTIVDHLQRVPDLPAMRVSSREALEAKLREPLPDTPSEFDSVLDGVLDDVFTSIGHLNHPRFFGFIPTPSNYISVLADTLAAGFTPFCGTWLEGSGPAQIELVALSWIANLCGLPEGAGGVFVSGGSLANLTALAAAREAKPDRDRHVVYCSDQTHSSIDRALKILGYTPGQFRKLESDDAYRLNPREVVEAVAADRAAGHVPLAVVANAGATNTGAVDPLQELASICRANDLWLHVDGAYGAAAVFSKRGRQELQGIGEADSISLDPHKWLFQPYPLGCVMLREPQRLRDVFHVMPEYLQDAETHRGEVNFCDYSPELTRPFRALKLWMSLKVFGAEAFERAIAHGFETADALARLLKQDDCWEIVSPPSMAIVCWRYRGGSDELQREVAHAAAADGCCFVSTTVLRGRTVLRMCTIQPATTERDLRMSLGCLKRYARAR